MESLKARNAITRLGEDVRTARKKRRIPTKEFAERIGVGEGTLARLEKGDPGVRIGTLAMALLALGEIDRLERLLDPGDDGTGLLLDRSRLPKRIDRKRARMPKTPDTLKDDDGMVF